MTQTDFIKYLNKHLNELNLPFDPKSTVKQLGIISTPVVSVSSADSAMQAFKTMRKNRRLAVPIVSESGDFVGALSNSHLRGLQESNINILNKSVLEYVAGRGDTVVTSDGNETMQDLLDKIVQGHLHRVWILEGTKVVGVVTLSDILKLFA